MKDLIPVAGNGLLDRRAFLRGGAALAAAIEHGTGDEPIEIRIWTKRQNPNRFLWLSLSSVDAGQNMSSAGCEVWTQCWSPF